MTGTWIDTNRRASDHPAKTLRKSRRGAPTRRADATRRRENAIAPRSQLPHASFRLTRGLMASMQPTRVLIADDQADIVQALRLLLADEGFEVISASSPADVIEKAEASPFDLALLDLNYTRDTTSGQEGLELMERLKSID